MPACRQTGNAHNHLSFYRHLNDGHFISDIVICKIIDQLTKNTF
jgi:hypothetical protein